MAEGEGGGEPVKVSSKGYQCLWWKTANRVHNYDTTRTQLRTMVQHYTPHLHHHLTVLVEDSVDSVIYFRVHHSDSLCDLVRVIQPKIPAVNQLLLPMVPMLHALHHSDKRRLKNRSAGCTAIVTSSIVEPTEARGVAHQLVFFRHC